MRVNSAGTNPYVYTDFDRKVFYNEKGLPLGSNSDIMSEIGKVYGFEIEVNLVQFLASRFDNKTGKWTGPVGSVRIYFSLKIILITNLQDPILFRITYFTINF